MRRLHLAILFCLAAAPPARGTANLDCEIADKSVVGPIGAIMGTLPGLMQMEGAFEPRAAGVPEDFRKVTLSGENLPHSWVRGRDIRLHAYKEREKGAFGSFELVIEAKGTDETYRGGYELTVRFMPMEGAPEAKTITLKGRASCTLG